MSIDISKFINVNIGYSDQVSVISQRDTAVLITNEGTHGNKTLFSSKKDWSDYNNENQFINTSPYVNTFFDNGGNTLLVVEGETSSAIDDLDDKYIVIAIVGNSLSENKLVATTLDSKKGIHRKILVSRATFDDLTPVEGVTPIDARGINSLAIKYSEHAGAEMAIAAYLTNVDIYGNNTVHDYSFTQETVEVDKVNVITNNLFNELSNYNVNFNVHIGGAIRNIGGNMSNGRSLINEFMLIVMHQTITDNLLVLLMSKIKGNEALSAIRSVITQELNMYVTNGYLDTNKIWDKPDWKVNHNGQTFTIITQDTPLSLGYWIQVLPWTSLNASDIQERKAPPIYIVIADSYGVRKIEVIGGVI